MWKYVKKYIGFGIIAALFMVGEVLMDLIQPGIMSRIVDEGVLGLNTNGIGDLSLIMKLGIVMIVLVLFGGFCGSMNNVFVHLTGQNIGNEVRKDCFCRIMTFSFPQIDYFGTGSLVTRVTNDITQVQSYISQFVRGMIRTTILMAGSIFCMFRLNHQFGIVVLCAFPFILGCMILCLYKANPLLPKLQAQLDQINAILQEDVSGIRIIKACVRELYEKMRFGKCNDALIKTQLQVLVIFAFMNPVMNALMYLVVVIILVSGSYQVGEGRATPGTIMAAITYTTQLLNGILMLVMLFQNITKGYTSWKRIKHVLDSEPELVDGNFNGETKTHGKIEFRDVSFAFAQTGQPVLNHINLTIQPGETVAIMGATGCGKTSLINLISRFYDVTGGAVLVDGVDVREYRQDALRQKISV
ncbi:MAG: ABC transporter ATP-binding protein, partial [Roseburia sp.]